jgi:PAS domain S-box-containing protein
MSRKMLHLPQEANSASQPHSHDLELQETGARTTLSAPVCRILVLEDLESDARLIEAELRRADFAFTSERVWTMKAFLEAIESHPPDVILADYTLPQFTAIDALQVLRNRRLRLPFILVTGTPIEQIAVDCMREGADDYILKASLRRLPGAIQNALSKHRSEIERQEISAELRASEERYRLITENTRDLVVLVDAAGEVLYASPSSIELLGITPEELAAGAASCIVHPEDRRSAIEVFRQAMLEPIHSSAELRCQHRNGEWRTFECRGSWIHDDVGVADRAVLVLRDITKRKQAAEELVAANVALEAREADLLRALAALQDSHEKLQSAQMALIEAEKMESVGRLAAGVAHEVKNPLTVIVMGVEYLRKHLSPAQSDFIEVLQDMDEAIKRANHVVRGMLDFSAPNTLQRDEIVLNDPIESALALLKHELGSRKIAVERRLDRNLPTLSLDRNKMEQVFVNIFLNAAEAIEETGTLIITTACRPLVDMAGKRDAQTDMGERVVVVEIEDTGSGIPEDLLTKVFDPFFTTKPTGKGTGLGMTVMKRIVELHGGLIRIENRAAGGARVVLIFPLRRAA